MRMCALCAWHDGAKKEVNSLNVSLHRTETEQMKEEKEENEEEEENEGKETSVCIRDVYNVRICPNNACRKCSLTRFSVASNKETDTERPNEAE